ncbi:MAG: SDR family oxidoreductase, partial [Acidobacteriaceae bacterium]|nr:SDR family oxidoreductase [Acidobacteriaceae bacterium]
MRISLVGKAAIVTGTSSGIGLAITRTFLDCGADGVVAAVFHQADVPEELQQCGAKYGNKLRIVYGDVAEEITAVNFTQAAVESFG